MKLIPLILLLLILFTNTSFASGVNKNNSFEQIGSAGTNSNLQQEIKKDNEVPSLTKTIGENSSNQTKNSNENEISQFIWTLFGGFIGAIIALLFEKFKNPRLEISATEEANQEHVYTNVTPSGRYKFFRVKVSNKQLSKHFSWLITRGTAQQVNATINFKEINKMMKGRWASTLELAQANPLDYLKLANFPDPITIFPGESTFLDVFVKYENEIEAYGWNNESYLFNWRTPHHKLNPGDHEIEITLSGVNAQIKKTFFAHIESTIDGTEIRG